MILCIVLTTNLSKLTASVKELHDTLCSTNNYMWCVVLGTKLEQGSFTHWCFSEGHSTLSPAQDGHHGENHSPLLGSSPVIGSLFRSQF